MASFCSNCGAPVAEGAAFCGGCGNARQAGPRVQASVASPAGAAPAAKSGSLLKVLLAVFGVLALFALIGVAGLVYTAYFVKEKITTAAKESGIDLDALAKQGRFYEPCSLLTKEEASQILGASVERAEDAGDTCNYFIRPPSDQEKSDAVAKAMESLQQQSGEATPSNPADRQGLEQFTKAWVGSNTDANTPYFTVQVHKDGNAMMAGTKLALLAAGGNDASEQLRGLGDQAVLGPLDSLLMFVKDGTGIQIDLRQVAQGRDRGIQMARRILTRM